MAAFLGFRKRDVTDRLQHAESSSASMTTDSSQAGPTPGRMMESIGSNIPRFPTVTAGNPALPKSSSTAGDNVRSPRRRGAPVHQPRLRQSVARDARELSLSGRHSQSLEMDIEMRLRDVDTGGQFVRHPCYRAICIFTPLALRATPVLRHPFEPQAKK